MSDVYDLDALEVEETAEPFRFTFGGQAFEIATHYDPRIFRRFNTGDLAGALEKMLGKEQFDRLDAVDKPFDERHFAALMQQWAEHFGTTVGEAQASSSSSNGTGRQSKPTSNASTESASPS